MQPKRQGRPPSIENARERILDDAANLFARGGYDGTSLGGPFREVSAATAQASSAEDALLRFMIAHADYFEDHCNRFLAMLVGYGGMQNVVMLAEAQQLRDDDENLLRKIISGGSRPGNSAAWTCRSQPGQHCRC